SQGGAASAALLAGSGRLIVTEGERMFHMVVSEPGPGLPWYSRVAYVDDQVIFNYTSGMQRVEPRTAWMAQNEGPEFWDLQNFWARRWEAWFNASLNTLRELCNHSEAGSAAFTSALGRSCSPVSLLHCSFCLISRVSLFKVRLLFTPQEEGLTSTWAGELLENQPLQRAETPGLPYSWEHNPSTCPLVGAPGVRQVPLHAIDRCVKSCSSCSVPSVRGCSHLARPPIGLSHLAR
uniref:MHC class I-like antigen recognition-like domain-containing protein n=1 Tax=Terrapene triunguis TaxID=2587831 RepID=A0A674K063_9SAUR